MTYSAGPGAALFPVVLALALLVTPAPLPGQTVDPFVGAVPVADRSEGARSAALGEALGQVLVKLSGARTAARIATAAEARRLVSQFRYRTQPADADEAPDGLELQVSFVPAGVRAFATEAGLPLWPLERGTTIVWLAIEDAAGRRLLGLGPDDDGHLRVATEVARARGVPMLVPLLDLEDQAGVSAAAVWGGFEDRVRQASERYGATHVFSGRIERSGGRWAGRWLLDAGGRSVRWDDAAETVDALLADAVHGLADRLAGRFAVRSRPGGGGGVRLVVAEVGEPSSFGALVQYLESRSVVAAVRLRRIAGTTITFEVDVRGDARALERVLALDDALLAAPVGAREGLSYRLGALRADAIDARRQESLAPPGASRAGEPSREAGSR